MSRAAPPTRPPAARLAVVALALGLLAPSVRAQPLDRDAVEALAVASAPEVRLAEAEIAAQAQRRRAVEAEGGTRWLAGAGLALASEPLTEEQRRTYRRGSAQAGLRVPLLGTREAQQRAVMREDAALQRMQGVVPGEVRTQVRRLVRLAWSTVVHNTERIRLTQAFLQSESEAADILRRRHDGNLLLDSDRLGFAAMFDTALRELARQQLLHDDARTTLERLAGRALGALDTSGAPLDAGCLDPATLLERADSRPEIRAGEAEVTVRRTALGRVRDVGIESSLTLWQAFSRDFTGQPGHSTTLAVDISLPLELHGVRDARQSEAHAELERAVVQLEQRRQAFPQELARLFSERRLSEMDHVSAHRQLDAALEAWRIARLRVQPLGGDALEQALQARYALYLAALADSDSRERRERAATALLALADASCPAAVRGTSGDAADDSASASMTEEIAGALASPINGAAAPARPALDWFAWQGRTLVAAPGRLDALPPGSRRLLVSFTADALGRLGGPTARRGLAQFVGRAHARGLRVDLLLGEPTWVTPAGRPGLLALLARVRHLPFDGLNLDLERSQLPEVEQSGWTAWTLATIRSVRDVVDWPVTLTTHHREFADPAFVDGLVRAGVTEVMPMVYVADPGRAAAIAARLLVQRPTLDVTVAQSVERALPADESVHRLGRRGALLRWRTLDAALSRYPNHRGIAVQSLEDFLAAPP